MINLTEALRDALSGLLPVHMVERLAPEVARRLREQMREECKKRLDEKGRLRWM